MTAKPPLLGPGKRPSRRQPAPFGTGCPNPHQPVGSADNEEGDPHHPKHAPVSLTISSTPKGRPPPRLRCRDTRTCHCYKTTPLSPSSRTASRLADATHAAIRHGRTTTISRGYRPDSQPSPHRPGCHTDTTKELPVWERPPREESSPLPSTMCPLAATEETSEEGLGRRLGWCRP
jgi:hypothetical protein